MNAITRAVIYARVSTDDQAKHGYSLQSQVEACKQYVDDHGWQLVATETDDGVSGSKLNRPSLDKVIDMANNHKFDMLVVYDIDRLARKIEYHYIINLELEKNGIKIAYVKGDFEGDNDIDRFTIGVFALIAELERGKIRERNVRGRLTKARNHKVVGCGYAPLGYRYENDAYHIVEEDAQIVRDMFRWYLDGASLSEICRRLESMGIRTRTGKTHWQKSSVRLILSHRTYTGITYYNQTIQLPDGRTRPRPEKEWIGTPVPAIISQSDWDAVAAKLKSNKKKRRRRPKHYYPLRGMLSCTKCKRAYSGVTMRGHRYYRDGSHIHRSLRANDIEIATWNAVKKFLKDPSMLEQGRSKAHENQDNQNGKIHDAIKLLEERRENEALRMARLTDAYLDLDVPITKQEYKERRQEIQNRIDALDREQQEHQESLKAEKAAVVHLEALHEFANQVSSSLDSATDETKREIYEKLSIQGDITWSEDNESAEIKLHGLIDEISVGLTYTPSARHTWTMACTFPPR